MVRVLALAAVEFAERTAQGAVEGLDRLRRELSRRIKADQRAQRFATTVKDTISKL